MSYYGSHLTGEFALPEHVGNLSPTTLGVIARNARLLSLKNTSDVDGGQSACFGNHRFYFEP